ncbi:MAG: response regulator [Pseudomonadales bacterium]|nr:response regulator [Pseudomonadales bacterium]
MANIFIQLYPGISAPLIIVTLVLASKSGLHMANSLLMAESVFLVGMVSLILMVNGFLPVNHFTSWALHIGFTGETILLSFALATRTRLAQLDAITNLQKFEDIYNNSIEAMFHFDAVNHAVKGNKALALLFGYDKVEDMPGDVDILSYFNLEVQEDLPSQLLENDMLKNYEARIKSADSSREVWVSLSLKVTRDNAGKLLSTEGFMVDISDRRLKERAEKERTEALLKEELSEQKNQAKTQFFASMSHEFRTPLTAILGYTEIAGSKETTDLQRKEYFKTVGHSAQHMLQLINDILDLSKIEAQKLDVESISVDLIQLSEQIRDFVWILANQKNIEFSISYQFPLPETFISDPTRLKQAIINLCSNAIKFTPEGSVIVHVSCDADTETLFFAVEDTGIGLRPDQSQKLFKAFEQADSSTSRNFGGTGLGLHLSKLIASKLGGDILVKSVLGEGSVFTLSVSTGSLANCVWVKELKETKETDEDETEDESQAETESSEGDSDVKAFKVLLAEDNTVNQMIISTFIKRSGVEVVIANDGLEAVAHALSEDFSLILMDNDMPHLYGLQVVSLLREKGISTPIYALTGRTDQEYIDQCIDAGCCGHLAKPLDTEKLKEIIESLKTEECESASEIIPIKKNDGDDNRVH